MSLRSLLLLTSLATGAAAASLKNCNASSLFSLNSYSLSPASPSPGQDVVLNLGYTVPDGLVVSGGETVYQFTFNFIPLDPTTNPLCQDIPCPLGPGTYANATKSVWPSGISGSFTSTMRWMDGGDQNYLCLQIAGKV